MLFFIPTKNISAQENNTIDLKKAIEISKNLFDIPDKGYNFNSSYNEYDGKKSWYLSWNSKDGKNTISVTIDANTGEVLNYYSWEYSDKPQSSIPKYSKEEAKKVAIEFANKVAPEKFKQTKEMDYPYPYYYKDNIYSPTYNFRFVRIVNDIPYQDHSITINVDKNTLKVTYYSIGWDDKIFPEPKNVISKDEAMKIFKDKIGLQLMYYLIPSSPNKNPQAVLVYSLKNYYPIDAITGELITSNGYVVPYYGPMGGMGSKQMMDSKPLSPEEQKAIDENSKFITKEKAIEILKSSLPFTIDEKYKLTSANLFSGYPVGTNATWNLSWYYNEGNKYNYISASVDAVTGELKSFYRGGTDYDNPQNKEPKYKKEQLKEIAEQYLKKIIPDKFKEMEYQDIPDNQESVPPYYSFNYIRKVDNIYYPFDSIYISLSTYTGEITSYNLNWVPLEIKKEEKILSIDDAYKALFNNANLNLNYITKYTYIPNKTPISEVKLAYVLENLNGMIDARTGELLDYEGKPVLKNKNAAFKDIAGHWAEKDINLLVQYNIIEVTEDKFKPEENITQRDFIKILLNSITPYSPPIIYYESQQTNDDELYNIAISKGIIKENEKNPNAFVTREDAAKFIVRSLNLGYIADISDIYNINFKDANKINPSLKGYIAIVSGLKLMTGYDGYFNPQGYIKRGETASLIVKYLRLEK